MSDNLETVSNPSVHQPELRPLGIPLENETVRNPTIHETEPRPPGILVENDQHPSPTIHSNVRPL